MLAYPQSLRGNISLSSTTIDSVVKFYYEDGISRASSNSKDTIKINGKPAIVRFLEMTILDAYRIFNERFPGVVSRSTFTVVRPHEVKIATPHETWMEQVLSEIYGVKSLSADNKIDMKVLITRMVCTTQKEEYFNEEFDDCPIENITDVLTHNNSMDLDEECSWTLWKKVDNKFDLQQMIDSVDSLLTEIKERWSTFLLHTYSNREQREYIKDLRSQSTDKSFIVAQIDFSMNYTLLRQREVQQGFVSQHQATLFTIHLTIGQGQRNLAIISNYLEHTTAFVYCAQKVLVEFIKKNFPLVKKINYLSDGACAHFKNNANILNLIHHKTDYDLEAALTFTAAGHGKGAGGGIGTVIKTIARRATLSKNILLSTAKDFFEFSKAQQLTIEERSNKDCPGVYVFYIEAEEVEKAKNNFLKARSEKFRKSGKKNHLLKIANDSSDLGTIRGIRMMHEFQPTSDTTVQYRTTSRSTHIRTFTFK
ncbi:unnamed protein product [Rotaria socialis]